MSEASMTRPTSVVISGQPFTIESVALDGDDVGKTLTSQQRILIDPKLAPAQERETVLHEIVHVIGMSAGHDLREGAVTALANLLLAVLRGNPELVEWLTDDAR